MSEAQKEIMRVQRFLREGAKISEVNTVAICGALSDAYAEGRNAGIEEAAKVADRHADPTGNDQWELGAEEIARDIRRLTTNEGE